MSAQLATSSRRTSHGKTLNAAAALSFLCTVTPCAAAWCLTETVGAPCSVAQGSIYTADMLARTHMHGWHAYEQGVFMAVATP